MRCVDVNVLVYAHRPEAPDHDRYHAWLEDARRHHEPLGINDLVLSGFLRTVTHPRVFRDPSPLETALEFTEGLRTAPSALLVAPGRRHWSIFARLCRSTEARGNLVPDAFMAALAIEWGATWYSADRSFARFADLRWRHPLEEG